MSCTLDRDIIVLDDNYTGQVKRNYQETGEIIDEVAGEYVRILRQLVEEEGISGETGAKLISFADTAEMLLKDIMEAVMAQITKEMEQYVEAIDEADKEIY